MALFPVAVVATGIDNSSASRRSGAHAWAAWIPLPAMITGLPARSRASARRVTSAGAARAAPCARCRPVSKSRGGRRVLTVPTSDRLAKTTATGPGVPVVACLIASWSVWTACFGSYTAAVYFVALAKRFLRSWLPCSPVPAWYGAWCMKGAMSVKSPRTSSGEAPLTASRAPKSALHARKTPWPMTTPGIPNTKSIPASLSTPTSARGTSISAVIVSSPPWWLVSRAPRPLDLRATVLRRVTRPPSGGGQLRALGNRGWPGPPSCITATARRSPAEIDVAVRRDLPEHIAVDPLGDMVCIRRREKRPEGRPRREVRRVLLGASPVRGTRGWRPRAHREWALVGGGLDRMRGLRRALGVATGVMTLARARGRRRARRHPVGVHRFGAPATGWCRL